MKAPSPKTLLSGKFIYQECLSADSILSETATFEEYPLIHRDAQYKNWKVAFPESDIFSMWIGVAVFLLNFFRNLDSSVGSSDRFLCITVNRFHEVDGRHPPVPSIFTSTALNPAEFVKSLQLRALDVDSKEMSIVRCGFESCNESRNFSFYESRFFDEVSKSEIVRIYCV